MTARPATCCLAGLVALALFGGGCQWLRPEARPTGRSPLAPLAPTANQAELEIFFVRLPSGDTHSAAEVWHEVDEQSPPTEVRRRLLGNGFRAGVIGTQLPPQIADVLARAIPPAAPNAAPAAESPDALGATRHQMFLRPRQRGELVASGVLKQFHVLEWREGQPQGATFEDGQAEFAVVAEPQADGRVRLELTPEIHHGPFQQHYVAGDGSFRLDSTRKKKVFDSLRIETVLAPGDVFVVGSRPDKPGSLGDRFFRESDGATPRPRLLLVRLSPSRHDPLFAPSEAENQAAPAARP